jgi:hypothetical protein
MTIEQRLTEWVQAGIDGGILKVWFHRARFLNIVHYTAGIEEQKREYVFIRIEYLSGLFRRERLMTVPDLINDNEFMKSVYGAKRKFVSEYTETEKVIIPGTISQIGYYQYIQQQAIILNGDKQVRYLYDKMKEGR